MLPIALRRRVDEADRGRSVREMCFSFVLFSWFVAYLFVVVVFTNEVWGIACCLEHEVRFALLRPDIRSFVVNSS